MADDPNRPTDDSGAGSAEEPNNADSEGVDRSLSIEAAVDELEAVDAAGASPGSMELRNDIEDAAAEAAALARAAEESTQATDSATGIPADVRAYDRFSKMDRSTYDRVNEFLRDRTYITAREWAIARLCSDFRTATGVEMTKIGEHLPQLVPFMTDTYSPQAVNQARSAFEGKVRKSGATFLYGAMSGFFTADQLDDVMYEVTEIAKFLLEVEGVDLTVDEELAAEERISSVMRDVRQASEELRHEGIECPECGHNIEHPDAHSEGD